MASTFTQLLAVLAAGLVAGFVNTMAGGGSFLTLIALDYAGLPLAVANGTNRVAILFQTTMAVLGFRSKGVSDFRLSLYFAVPALVGAILGAQFVGTLPEDVFQRVLGVAMLAMLAVILLNPKRWLREHKAEFDGVRRWWAYPVFFAVGLYGGAIQAGVGFLLIAALVLTAGLDLVRTNSHKVFIVGVYTVFAVIVFALRGQVNWLVGAVLAVGNGTGGWLASRLAVRGGERLVRVVLGVLLAVFALRYLGVVRI